MSSRVKAAGSTIGGWLEYGAGSEFGLQQLEGEARVWSQEQTYLGVVISGA